MVSRLAILACFVVACESFVIQCAVWRSKLAPGDHLSAFKKDSAADADKKKPFTIGDLQKELLKNPSRYIPDKTEPRNKNKSRRTRQRVENPKQTYLYKSQRLALEKAGKLTKRKSDDESETEEDLVAMEKDRLRDPIAQAKEFGLQINAQHCDPLVDEVEPSIVGQIRVGDDSFSASYAYLIDKPAGWSILGSGSAKKAVSRVSAQVDEMKRQRKTLVKQVKIVDEDGSTDTLEYNELDVMALLTPEELEEYLADMAERQQDKALPSVNRMISGTSSDAKMGTEEGFSLLEAEMEEETDPERLANLRRIAVRAELQKSDTATFVASPRPSVVSWLKDLKAAEGTPIRGGNFWTAVAGAAEVDDSGLVLVCPKTAVAGVFVDFAEYLAVVGNGGYLAPTAKGAKGALPRETLSMDVVATLKKGRNDDVVHAVKIVVPEAPSSCSSVVEPCQEQLQQGIRGDPAANPFDRRARRRLIHCRSMSVSSLVYDENMQVEIDTLPDDIAVLASRRNDLTYKYGSFLGRASLRDNDLTNTYREINGSGDGFPGWTVDRYDGWLFVQHDPMQPRGPLPSIHDGRTAGVYLLDSILNRSPTGATSDVRPRLLEGKPAPDVVPVVESGVTYLVSLDKDLSTGIFLDQRPQRAWLTRNCCPSTHVLNCFAHTGAFSVAAASAGAATVSLDLSHKWLERLPEQFRANGIDFDEHHDCIYGDCFDWLVRLAKRGEKYDIVILDPPSASVGGRKKKRWSIKNDMDELVALAAGLVKKGGLLWTTTNSASIHPIKFARLCQKGLEQAGVEGKLERIQPMPSDFPTVGAQPVKNLVWRIQ